MWDSLQQAYIWLIGFFESVAGWPDWAGIAFLIWMAATCVVSAVPGVTLKGYAKGKAYGPYQLVNDVLVRPSIGPVTGWLVGGLLALVVWLTIQYAPDAAERAKLPHGAGEGVISVIAGYWTIGLVALLAIAFGWEPIVSPRLGQWFRSMAGLWRRRESWEFVPQDQRAKAVSLIRKLPGLIGTELLAFAGNAIFVVWRSPSFVLSLFDYAFARPLAWLAGATVRPMWLRYVILAVWVFVGAWVGIFVAAPYGLVGVACGIVAIVAIVRRWNWIERDRESFLAARGSDPETERVGFAEDLRDEALTGIAFLFILIPIGFRQVNLAYDAFAFNPAGGAAMPADWLGQVWMWMGFFGAELAKAVPLVDWSEVFHVANGSPIEPKTALGAQIVFAMRASLDLLLIAAVVQAVQIAARIRDQRSAFLAGKLPILDPFAELASFRSVALRLVKRPYVEPWLQPSVRSFPKYEEDRLIQIAASNEDAGAAILKDAEARSAALAILVRQHSSSRTDVVLAGVLRDTSEPLDLRLLALRLLAEGNAARAEAPLLAVLDPLGNYPKTLCLEAASLIGRLRCSGAGPTLLARLQDVSEASFILRAHCGLAAAKIGFWSTEEKFDSGLLNALLALSPSGTQHPEIIAAMTKAYALALYPGQHPESELLGHFSEGMQPFALRAIKSARGEHEVMVDIPAGSFLMGSPEGEEWANIVQLPQHKVTVPGLQIGKFAVTFAEYDAFCDATGRDRPGDMDWGRDDRPVINVSWDDAQDYCYWLTAFTGERYRLPSEAEWEYACRAGKTTPFSFGETISTDQANYDGNYTYGAGVKGEYREKTVPVGSLPANPFGLHEMHGNVWEWCADAWNWSYRQTLDRDTERPDDGAPWLTGDQSWRVLRGGSWYNTPKLLRSAERYWTSPWRRDNEFGFRLARNL